MTVFDCLIQPHIVGEFITMIHRMLMAIVDGNNVVINLKTNKVAATITLFANLTLTTRAITQTMFGTHMKLLFLQCKSQRC